ncbi:MAG: DUF3857 domain-containing protein [Polyangiaceae bacterium]|nr:DUF3857 domain-containing protein [Polyangiaceae bacterium]
MRARAVFALAAALSVAGCGAAPAHPTAAVDESALVGLFDDATRAEQLDRDPRTAIDRQATLLERAAADRGVGLLAVAASLDALVWRQAFGLDRATPLHALAFRVPDASSLEARVAKVATSTASSPWARALAGQAALDLARYRGDAEAASRHRAAAGLVTRATLLGPVSSSAHAGLAAPQAWEAPGAVLPRRVPGAGPLAPAAEPLELSADDGVFDLAALSSVPGTYALGVDLSVDRDEEIGVLVRSRSAARVSVGGAPVGVRPFAAGPDTVVVLGQAALRAGTTRLWLKIGAFDDGPRVALHVVGTHGPVRIEPARAETSAAGVATGNELFLPSSPLELSAAASLALGRGRSARAALEGAPESATSSLLLARALSTADDVPETKRILLARAAWERADRAWPGGWEPVVASATFSGARKGPGEGRVETLAELSKLADAPPIVSTFVAATAVDVGLRDVARAALAKATPLDESPLAIAVRDRANPLTGADAERVACEGPGRDRQSLACLGWKKRRGDHAGALAELTRLRALRGSPTCLTEVEIALRLGAGDLDGALAAYDRASPGERSLALLAALPPARSKDGTDRLARDAARAKDSPAALGPLSLLFGADPAKGREEAGRAAAKRALASPAGGEATQVALHDERYELSAAGVLHAVIHDVRRVAGTTDVEQGVGGTAFAIAGRDARRTLRRLIHKRDGRTLEPDRAENAAQGNSDLSQLEPGDVIEQLVETFALPDRAGHLVVDTPDLMPERTGVAEATIELSVPSSLQLSTWSHPLLGAPTTTEAEGRRTTRWRMRDLAPRRIEDGTPQMDRDVSVSFWTYSWADVGHLYGDYLRALTDRDTRIAAWAKRAAGDETTPSRALVQRVVTAAGKALRVANGSLLSDQSAYLTTGPSREGAMAMLELGQGSRTLVAHRALSALGVANEIVAAEREPFSADPKFPARPGRFMHPLLLAHLPDGDVWIDADVPGPPPPIGWVSPELLGRSALRGDGSIVRVPDGQATLTDELSVDLTLDDKGNAKGKLTTTLRGRQAQALADALDTVVGTDRRELLRRVVLGWLPWATVDEVTLTSGEGSWEVSVTADVTVPSYAEVRGDALGLPGLEPVHFVFPRSQASTLASTFASKGGRTSALAVDLSMSYRARRRVKLPPGVKIEVTRTVEISDRLVRGARRATVSGDSLDEEFSLTVLTGTVAAPDFSRFAGELRKIDDGFLASTRARRAR